MTCGVEVARTTITCILVTALCNQPEAFASNLGDDQSRYLFCYKFGEYSEAGDYRDSRQELTWL